MTPADRWRRVRAVFDQAITLEGDERAAYVTEACGADQGMLEEVRALLDADASAGVALGGAVSSATAALSEESMPTYERIGPYRVLGELGRGGMGVVYRAERDDGTYRQEVAVKLIPRHLGGPDAQRRFLVERQILAELDHPAIARLLDGGTTDDGLPYLVMEFVDGEPIDAYCRRKELGLEARLELVAQVADAVAHAHSRLVVHRDLKPANLLITEDGRPKLLDFGIARVLETDTPRQTRTGIRPMTPEYASPEQVAGEPVTALSDVYSLGVLLYELLTGASPYGAATGSTPAHLARAISETTPTRPSVAVRRSADRDRGESEGDRLAPVPAQRLEGDLDAIALTALRKDAVRRYASAERFAADLRAFLAGRPVSARADSWTYRTGKWLRRNPLVAALATLVLLALLGGLAARTQEARRAEREAERASAAAEVAREEAARANREAEVAEQVSRFLEGLFASTTPSESKGRDVTARELLDAGVARVDEELADQPLVQARLLHAMGSSYRSIGLFETAEDLLLRALALRQASEAPPLDVAATHMDLTHLLEESQRPEEAEPHVRSAVAIYEAQGEEAIHPLVVALGELGLVLNRQMQLAEAEATVTRALDLYSRLPEPDVVLAAGLEVKLASLLADQGKPVAALASFERVLELSRKIYSADHVRAVVALNNVGQARIEVGRAEDAEAPLREALEIARKLLDPAHPLLGTVLRNLGGSLARQGRLDEAEPVLDEALTNHREAFGEEHFLTHLAGTSLGIVRLRQGRLDEAGRRFARARAVIEPVFGSEHLVVGELHHLEGEVHRARGNLDAARASFERSLAIRQPIFGPEGRQTHESRDALEGLEAGR